MGDDAMTVEEPTGFELMRTLESMRADQRAASDALNKRLDGLVSQVGLNEIIRRLDGNDAAASAAIAKVDAGLNAKYEALDAKVERKFAQLTNRIWFVFASILIPVAFFLFNWLRGPS